MSEFSAHTLNFGPDYLTAYDHGAHVAQWIHEHVPVVWVSQRAEYVTDQAIRGGIPVIWPWFADGPTGEAKPPHGVLRTAQWRLSEQSPTRLVWEVDQDDTKSQPGIEQFQHRYKAQLEVELSENLRVTLTVHNTDDHDFVYEAALHTYLHVGDVQAVHITGLEDIAFFDKVTQATRHQDGPLTLSAETDRIYDTGNVVCVHDPVLEREVTVSPIAGTQTIVWNPWEVKAVGMNDFADHEWSQMLCIETARLGQDQIRLSPGESHTLGVTISVDKPSNRTAR